MAEGHGQGRIEEEAANPEPGPVPVDESQAAAPQPSAARRLVVWPIAVLGLVIAAIILSPFWAPDVAPLLPWGGRPWVPMPDLAAFDARLVALERRPAPPAIDLEPVRSAQSALARRVDQLEAARNTDRPSDAAISTIKAGLQQFEQQLGALEVKSASRATGEAAEIGKLQQELTRLGTITADLAGRLGALEQQSRAQSGTWQTDAVLLAALLQIREALDHGRPFAAEFSAFMAFAHNRPDLAAAAAPLADAARDGMVEHAVLTTQLAAIAGHIASASALPPKTGWEAQVLARLRSLVTIRRIDGAPKGGPEAAVSAAEAALGRGDLGQAVVQLDGLTGANAEAAGPWLRMARQRLAVERALTHLQELLVTDLGHPSDAPERAPADAPAKPDRSP